MKPSEKILCNPFDGKEVKDKNGRIITLRKPNILDRYDLFSALENDAKNPMCLSFAMTLLHVAKIDGVVFSSPRSIKEFRVALSHLGDEGNEAVMEYINSVGSQMTEQEEKESAKK